MCSCWTSRLDTNDSRNCRHMEPLEQRREQKKISWQMVDNNLVFGSIAVKWNGALEKEVGKNATNIARTGTKSRESHPKKMN